MCVCLRGAGGGVDGEKFILSLNVITILQYILLGL